MSLRIVAARAAPDGRSSTLLRHRGAPVMHPQERPEIIRGCANARQLAKICDLLEAFPGQYREISWDLHRGRRSMPFTILAEPELAAVLIEDPDLRPYLWDLEEC